jgi:hypothetical protein
MRSIVENIKIFIIAIIGLIGGGYWIYKSNWDMEPIILTSIALVEIVAYLILKFIKSDSVQENQPNSNVYNQRIINKGKVKKQINIQKNKGNIKM